MRKMIASVLVAGGALLLMLAGTQVASAWLAQRSLLLPAALAETPVVPRPAAADRPALPAEPPPALQREYQQGEPLFKLEIPRIEVRNIVVYGSSEQALRKGPGLVERTAMPGGQGNTVISAHRDYYFWRLNELEPGDQVRITTDAGTFLYSVTDKKVIKETQTEIMDPTSEPTVTLVTCWPLIFAGRTPDRLVVTAVRNEPRFVPNNQ